MELAKQEIAEYNLNSIKHHKVNKMALFKEVTFRKALSLGLIIGVGSQVVGFSAVLFYLQPILQSTNTNIRPEIASVIIGVIQVLISFVSHSLLSSRLGRKTILILTLCTLFIGMVSTTILVNYFLLMLSKTC